MSSPTVIGTTIFEFALPNMQFGPIFKPIRSFQNFGGVGLHPIWWSHCCIEPDPSFFRFVVPNLPSVLSFAENQ